MDFFMILFPTHTLSSDVEMGPDPTQPELTFDPQ